MRIIKDNIYIVLLIAALAFFLIPSSHTSHSLQDHLLLLTPTLLCGIFFLKNTYKKRPGFKLLASFIILLFISFYVFPTFTTFAYHHQLNANSTHPCCMPQSTTSAVEFVQIPFVSAIQTVYKTQAEVFEIQQQSILQNKSPPVFI